MAIINAQSTIEFNIHIGDVIFFPIGTQHYIKSTCDEDLLLVRAFSTGDQVRISQFKRDYWVPVMCSSVKQWVWITGGSQYMCIEWMTDWMTWLNQCAKRRITSSFPLVIKGSSTSYSFLILPILNQLRKKNTGKWYIEIHEIISITSQGDGEGRGKWEEGSGKREEGRGRSSCIF